MANWFLRHLPTRLAAVVWFVMMGLFAANVVGAWVRATLRRDVPGVVVALVFTAAAGIPIAASIGVSSQAQSQVMGFDQLFKMADEAVYEAKQTGRNKVVCKER